MRTKLFILIVFELCLATNLAADPSDNVYCVVVRFSGCSPVNGYCPDLWCLITTEGDINGRDYKLFRTYKNGLWPRVWEYVNGGGGAYTTRYVAYNWPLLNEDYASGLSISLITTEYGYQLYASTNSEPIFPNIGGASYFSGNLLSFELDGKVINSDYGGCACCAWYYSVPPWSAFMGGTATLKTLTVDLKTFAYFASQRQPSEDYSDLETFCNFWLVNPNEE